MTEDGFALHRGWFNGSEQKALVRAIFRRAAAAPFYRPVTPGGRAMSVEMTNFGPLGWITDARGYRYGDVHPESGAPWPSIPRRLHHLWQVFADPARPPDACLVNLYRNGSRMGLHQDHDEEDYSAPVVSVSLGDTAVFRLGGVERREPTRSFQLLSGDVCLLAGADRLAFHGVDRILPGTSGIIPGGGRINLTLRKVR
jgi:alkylated DNA repair protein (DNA oxidative demethylase)